MYLSDKFICAGTEFSTIEKSVPAPILRRVFDWNGEKAELTVCGLGFYELYVNGVNITRGMLSPYISNPNDIVYYDGYDITPYLRRGENALAAILGNGMQNAFGGWVWDFEKADFRGAPRLALALELDGALSFEADGRFVTHPSPVVEDDLRLGERYDARLELPGFAEPSFDDSGWSPALPAKTPSGEKRLCDTDPIVEKELLAPVKIWEEDGAYIYDFGKNLSGVARLCVNGEPGQKITLTFGEWLKEGGFYWGNITFPSEKYGVVRPYVQRDEYICAGGAAVWEPRFTYHGFRYVKVEGITEKQATRELLTFVVWHTDLETRGGFECSDRVLNRLFEMTFDSTRTNFHHFPTDCPHREKNGWTADAALSAEQAILTLSPERNYKEWLRGIVKAQREDGALPGIVPTAGWGFEWGNGPAWDQVLIELPYRIYEWTGDTEAAQTVMPAAEKYIRYLEMRRDGNGLLAIGLGDWCDPVKPIRAPLAVTDSMTAMSIAERAAVLANAVGADPAPFERFRESMRKAIRANLLDGVTVSGDCQCSQAMGLFYGVFDENERDAAFKVLLSQIEREDGHIACGVLGLRVMFRVLAENGYIDLALKMIARPDPPSYGYWESLGLNTLSEHVKPKPASLNHHFQGDISALFISYLGGIRPDRIEPRFSERLTRVHAWHDFPQGRVDVSYIRRGGVITMDITAPQKLPLVLSDGWECEGKTRFAAAAGTYIIKRREKQ